MNPAFLPSTVFTFGKRLLYCSLLAASSAMAAEFPQPFNTEVDQGSPMPAAEAAAKMQVPPGFKVDLFAAEPDVQNPIAMAFDARGRMWVAENNTYAGGTMHFDLSLRDRVLILEDKDHDGHAESRKVFTDNVQMLTSVETGRGGVWLMCPPQLLFIPDANGDDVPDGPPQVVLDGFTVAASNYHNFANGLRWGPDGWLYGRCGHSCPGRLGVPGTPDEQRVPIKGGIWRYHPERKIVEVLTHGTTNPWGHDWDENGELFFINTVTGHLWHLIHGAHLVDSRPSPNPGVYERLDTIADHYHYDRRGPAGEMSRDGKASELGGGHAHIGMMIYLAHTWPEQYRGKLFTLNMHGRRANMERLERLGSGYVGRHEPDFLFSADPWFRGLEISTGPDGNAFVLDWSDTGECHEYTGVHRTSGRVFKISYGDAAKDAPMLKPRCLMGDGPLPPLWKQYQEGRTTPAQLRALLTDPDEHVRVWAIRLLTDFWPLDTIVGPLPGAVYPEDSESLALFVKLAREDRSGLVRLSLASTLQRLPPTKRAPLAAALLSRAEDAGDAQLPAMVWYGLIPLAETDPAALVSTAAGAWPKVARWTARMLATKLEEQPAPLNELLTRTLDPQGAASRQAVLEGMAEAFKGWQKAPKPAVWDRLTASTPPSELVRDLSVLFGSGRALDDVKKIALDPKADLAQRQTALRALVAARPPDLKEICTELLTTRFLCSVAIRGLAAYDDPALGRRLAQDYRKFASEDRPAVLELLVSRPTYAAELLANIGTGKTNIARADLTAFHARQIRALGDEALTKKLAEVWGEVRESTGDKRQLIQSLKAQLTPAVLRQASLSQGRVLFQSVCAACHTMYGIGGNIGPDLTGSGRANLDYLLENIVDPSAVVSVDYRMSLLTLKDGRVLTGVLGEANARSLTLRTPAEPLTLDRRDIARQEISPVSMMPEGLLQAFSPEQVRDLLAYLMYPTQVPLPEK
jgi:putative membrane-bound dehydrogenase-like protein